MLHVINIVRFLLILVANYVCLSQLYFLQANLASGNRLRVQKNRCSSNSCTRHDRILILSTISLSNKEFDSMLYYPVTSSPFYRLVSFIHSSSFISQVSVRKSISTLCVIECTNIL